MTDMWKEMSRRARAGTLQAAWLAVAAILLFPLTGRAEVSSDEPAAVLIFPKLIVDSANNTDTIIRLTNTSLSPLTLHCFWVDATPRCKDGEGNCAARPGQEGRCTGTCVNDQWNETDFRIILTARQPIGWEISKGMRSCRSIGEDPSDPDHQPCFVLDGILYEGPGGQSNATSNILPVPHDQFVGYLQCIAVDDNGAPVERNDAKGEALIVRTDGTGYTDVDGYNAIGLQAIAGRKDRNLTTLCLGGCSPGQCKTTRAQACFNDGDCPSGETCSVQCQPNPSCPNGPEYDGCANILILDHFFDGAADPMGEKLSDDLRVVTDLTLVPCSQDYLRQDPKKTAVQFLVFNEFEQRFSTSRPVTCFEEIQLSNIDTRFNENSIFSAGVNGTLTGQTRIRGVADDHTDHGHALVGIARELRCDVAVSPEQCDVIRTTAAFNLHSQGRRPQADLIALPPE
jgi:hypothetical protein